jgi:hypothetical protein
MGCNKRELPSFFIHQYNHFTIWQLRKVLSEKAFKTEGQIRTKPTEIQCEVLL